MKLSVIVPLPASAARHPAAVFTPIAGEPALSRIVRSLTDAAQPHAMVVAVAESLADDVRACLSAAGSQAVLAVAGETPSTADCLAVAAEHLRADAVTHVLVADHRYPLMPAGLVCRVIDALAAGADLVIPVLPVTDSVKVVDAQGVIVSTMDRSVLRIAQNPRGARLDQLDRCAGDRITTVEGDPDANAVDLPADAALVEAIIACRR